MIINSRITVVAAHPDDLEIGMGQLLLELLDERRGNSVSLCVVTGGGAAGAKSVRRREQRDMAAFLKRLAPGSFAGMHPESYAFADTQLMADRRLITYLERVCNGSDVVFTHYPNDSHQDHRALGTAIRPACRFTRNVLFFQSYSALDFQPSLFFDFTREEMESERGKLKLLKFHKSQIKRYAGSRQDIVEDMYALAAYNGFLYKSPKRYAEGFVPWKVSLQSTGSRDTVRPRRSTVKR
jgi:LmbE family N-acetylglucosaminyl deacetylase